jgi:hypothetical protein
MADATVEVMWYNMFSENYVLLVLVVHGCGAITWGLSTFL